MKIGYITFSSEEQQLVHDVIQQISQGAIDELGLGRIRDAFSDAMFPGMSTLHRKSKYFVLLPALYDQLSKKTFDEKNAIQQFIRKYEITMAISLLNGADGTSDNTGITGSSVGIQGLRDGKFVKITPTSIYLSALKYFGLVEGGMNLNDLIYQQSKYNHEQGATNRRTKEEITEDPDGINITSGHKQSFYPFTGYDFSKEGKIDMKLTVEEASVLRSRIINKCRDKYGKDNLYSFLLSNDHIQIENDFFKMKNIINELSGKDELKKVYNLAYDFSHWAHLMNTYYRLAFYQKTGNNTRVSELREHISDVISKKEYPSHDRIAEILKFVKQMPDFHDVNRLCEFCDESSKIVGLPAEENRLISLICNREKSIKGSHYKIGNTRYKNTDFSGNAGYYTYRWNEIVYSMVNDIRNPQL